MKKQIAVNDAYIPFLDSQERIQIFYGGSSSGKSFFLSQRCIMDVIKGRNYLVVRQVGATIRNSVFNQLVKTIGEFGLNHMFSVSLGTLSITYLPTGKQILFSGLDDVEKLKSVTPRVGVLTDVWIEEATEVDKGSYKQLTKRLRGIVKGDDGKENNITKRITFSFNPVLQTHWIYKEFFGKWDDNKNLYREKDLLIRKTTYKDNKFLTDDDINALENEKDEYFYEVYTKGNWGILGKLIFKNWRVEDLSQQIQRFDNIYCGLDFGYSEDPNAFIKIHVDNARKIIYVFDELYKCGMQNDELAEELKKRMTSNEYVTCDSAEPKSIDELVRNGVRAIPAIKGADSINYGIKFLQGYTIIIDVRCQNFKNEIQEYSWQEDKFGNALRKPIDKNNHLLDALRYAVESLSLGQVGGSIRRM